MKDHDHESDERTDSGFAPIEIDANDLPAGTSSLVPHHHSCQ